MLDVVDIDIANKIKQDALSIIQSQYNRKSTGEQLKVNKKKMAEKEAFYCTISFLLFAAIRSFLTNLPYYFSVVHAFQSSALHLSPFTVLIFWAYNANIPRPCQCGRNLMKFGNSLVHLSPNVTFSQIFCYRAHWIQSYLCLFFFFYFI